MRSYAVRRLYPLVQAEANAASTIPEIKAALMAARNLIKHLPEHNMMVEHATLGGTIQALEHQYAELSIAEARRIAQEKHDAKIAWQRDPLHKIKRMCASRTTAALKADPTLLKNCNVYKVDRRNELRSMGRDLLLAEGLTHKELMTFKAFAQSHYKPIKWVMP